VPKTTSVLIAGVGGQGSVLASKLLGAALVASGFDVKMSEVHGMAQRGGSVVTQVRFGEKVFSPLIGSNEADFLVAFEPLEALRWASYLSEDGVLVTDNHEIPTPTVNMGVEKYPDVISELQKYSPKVINAIKEAEALGNWRTANVVMLGVISLSLPVEESIWHKALQEVLPPKHLEINMKAFLRGRELAA